MRGLPLPCWVLSGFLALTSATPGDAQERLVVLTEPGTPIIATDILLTVGPIDEGDDRAGLAHLAARSIVAQITPSLDSLGARASVTTLKDGLSLSITAAPDVWEEATRLALVATFRESPDSATVARERQAIVTELRGRLANPADVATYQLDRAFYGENHPWGRPSVGTPETVERLTSRQVEVFLADHFTPDRAYAAVVGPVEESEARAHLRPFLGTVVPAPVQVVPFESEVLPVRTPYNSITTWVSASYRFRETADEEAVRFVIYLTADALSFSPAQRSVYNVWSEVRPRVGGGEARLQIVVPPEEATDWADRLQEFVVSLTTTEMHEDVFAAHLRRYRGERVMELIAPEDRARAATHQLQVRGRYLGIIPDLDEMTPQRVRAAAAALGRPTLVILGPTLD
jgi:predicted Zn-dependent peptidase